MPEISRFFGIIIRIRLNDHAPPHFHVVYGEEMATVDMRTLRILAGSLRPRVRGLVVEWAAAHEQELLADWDLARRGLPPRPIAPLE